VGTSFLLRGRFAPTNPVATAVPKAVKGFAKLLFVAGRWNLSPGKNGRPGNFDRQLLPGAAKSAGCVRQFLPIQ